MTRKSAVARMNGPATTIQAQPWTTAVVRTVQSQDAHATTITVLIATLLT